MIQKRRDQFKRQIRRRQLEAIFKERRIQLLEPLNFYQYSQSVHSNPLGRSISECLNNIQDAVRFNNFEAVESSFEFLLKLLKEDNLGASAYLMALSHILSRLLRRIIENKECLAEDENEYSRISSSQQLQTTTLLFNLLSKVNYREVQESKFVNLMAAFWLIFTCDELNIYEQAHHHLFDLVLLIFKRMLNSRSRIVLSALKAAGLGHQLVRIIQFDMEYLTHQNQLDLMETVEMYIMLQSKFHEGHSHELNGKLVLQLEKSEKEVMVALCLSNIKNNRQECFFSALNTLVIIFQRHPYLIHAISSQARPISALLNSPLPRVQLKALQLIDDLIHKDDGIGCDLLKQRYLPNLLYSCLLRHRKQPNETTHSFCCMAANVLCNLTICRNRDQQQLSNHQIWELAYQNIQMTSPLLPLVTVFQYYFEILHRRTAIKVLQSYLDSVGALEFNFLQPREYEGIKRTIQRVYANCLDFWPEDYEHKFSELIERNKLTGMLEEVMDVEDQKYLHPL